MRRGSLPPLHAASRFLLHCSPSIVVENNTHFLFTIVLSNHFPEVILSMHTSTSKHASTQNPYLHQTLLCKISGQCEERTVECKEIQTKLVL